MLLGDNATVQNSLVYNGSKIDGTVRNSILFPGIHVKKGAVVENSVLFFNNLVKANCLLNKVVSDVNNTFGENVVIGREPGALKGDISVIGWSNNVPGGTLVGDGATVYPKLAGNRWPDKVRVGEVLR